MTAKKPKDDREKAARALCRLNGQPEDTMFEGDPMWMSYLPEVDVVLKAVGGNEPRAFGFKDIGASDDGKWARIVFVGRDLETETPIQLAADLLDKMLPSLMAVAAECERRREGGNPRHVYQIKKGSIGATTEDGIVFEFVIPTGHHLAFEVDRIGAQLLLESLSTALRLEPAQHQTGKADRPKGH